MCGMRLLPTALTVLAAVAVATAPAAFAAPPASAYKNCTEYRKSFPHGVGTTSARDKTSGRPVTTFRKDNAEFKRAMGYNRGLDGDKDSIACEKA